MLQIHGARKMGRAINTWNVVLRIDMLDCKVTNEFSSKFL